MSNLILNKKIKTVFILNDNNDNHIILSCVIDTSAHFLSIPNILFRLFRKYDIKRVIEYELKAIIHDRLFEGYKYIIANDIFMNYQVKSIDIKANERYTKYIVILGNKRPCKNVYILIIHKIIKLIFTFRTKIMNHFNRREFNVKI